MPTVRYNEEKEQKNQVFLDRKALILNMTMKTCICIAGMPASGKTTAALRLSGKLGIAMLSKDEIKEKLFDRIGFQSRQEKVQLGLAAMEILYYAAERCLAASR